MKAKAIMCRFLMLAMVAAMAALVFLLAQIVAPRAALADEGSASGAAPGTASGASSGAAPTVTMPGSDKAIGVGSIPGGLPMMGNDYVWFGRNLELSDHTVSNDLIAAGEIVSLRKMAVAGDYRVAAQIVTIQESSAGQNVTVAAEVATIRDLTAKAVAVAGKTVRVGGTCDSLVAYGETVRIDGVVNGDVVVGASAVEIGETARIKGTLRVSSANEPTIRQGAEVANVEFTRSDEPSRGQIISAFAELFMALSVFLAIMIIFGTLVISVLAEWLFRRQTAGAANMIRTRTGETIGTGVVGALVAPLVVILLICFGITLPVAGSLAFALFAVTFVASGFAGASLFKLVFKNMGRFPCALAGGAIVGVVGAIPLIGGIVHVAAFMYLLGYILQSIYLGMRDPSPVPSDPVGQENAPRG